ncbi:hypothetical protein DFH07DRAFT_784809 [Mycena maculata]|uniref:Uncharacterized protein n=1 Tax=Mycena maculata TaxID=230809 RepID=A0AAD7MJ63_9AGAR|nr:hypothetical protein DFH07DRAFT_784809 [Mycena maculata]
MILNPHCLQRACHPTARDREGDKQKKQEVPETTREIDVRKTKCWDSVQGERGAVRVALDQRGFEAAEVVKDISAFLDEADEYAAKEGQDNEDVEKTRNKIGQEGGMEVTNREDCGAENAWVFGKGRGLVQRHGTWYRKWMTSGM